MASFEISTCGALLSTRFTGHLVMDDIRRATAAFHESRQPLHDRFLMDYLGVTGIDIPVQDFIAAGLGDQSRMPPLMHIKAAYVADHPQVFGYIRIIEGVWNSHLDVRSFRQLPPAMDWLGLAPPAARPPVEKTR